MGYLEGLLSHDRIYDAYYNIIHSSNPVPAHVLLFASQQVQSPPSLQSSATPCTNSHAFVCPIGSAQLLWMKDQVNSNPTSPYWQHVGISLAQVREFACLPHPQQVNKHLIVVMVMGVHHPV